VDRKENSVFCIKCKKWIHQICSGLNEEQISAEKSLHQKNEGSYSCSKCNITSKPTNHSQSDNLILEKLNQLAAEVNEIKQTTSKTSSKFETVIDEVHTLKNVLKKFQIYQMISNSSSLNCPS